MRKIDLRQLVRQQDKKKKEAAGKLGPKPTSRLLRFAADLVGIASVLPPGEAHQSTVPCRRRPRRRPCPGSLSICRTEPDDEIRWECPSCRDAGIITSWHGSRWDREPALRSGQVVSLLQVRASRGRQGRRMGPAKAYELVVDLIGGPMEFAELIRRRVRIGGDRSLHELHQLLHRAFDREDDEPYEFMFGAPYEADSKRFTGGLVTAIEGADDEAWETKLLTLEEIGIKDGQVFGYLFDFGEEWIHRISVNGVVEEPAYAIHPRVLERVGTSPPQYPDLDDLWDDEGLWHELDEGAALGGVYGPYDPETAPDPANWLALEELERLLLLIEAHEDIDDSDDNDTQENGHGGRPTSSRSHLVHALLHFVAETAIAEGKVETRKLWATLPHGQSRHHLLHLLGQNLLAQQLTPPSERADIEPSSTP